MERDAGRLTAQRKGLQVGQDDKREMQVPYKDPKKAKQRAHENYMKHREERLAYRRKYSQEHPWKNTESQKAYRREYYRKNKDRINARNKEYHRDHAGQMKGYYKEYYKQHRDKYQQYAKVNSERFNTLLRKRMAAKQKWINDMKRDMKCSMCGQSFPDHPSVIDFHHVGGEDKLHGIGRMKSWPKKAILAEIAKCIPLCANCHRRVHHLERRKGKGVHGKDS